jgi:hypothetical protein
MQLTRAARVKADTARRKRRILVLLFGALYDSRRRQAERTLIRYHDVIGRAQLRNRREPIAHTEAAEHSAIQASGSAPTAPDDIGAPRRFV